MESAIDKAAKEVQAHQFDEAKKLLDPVLKQVPDHAGAHFLLATMAYGSRDFAGALDHIETSERSLKDLDQRYTKLLPQPEEDDPAERHEDQRRSGSP